MLNNVERAGDSARRWTGAALPLLVLLAIAFAASASKMQQQAKAADFAALRLPSLTAAADKQRPAPAPPAPAFERGPQKSPDERLTFQTGFVSNSPGQAVHAPSVVELRNGDLRAVWFSGSREGARDVTVQSAVMDKSTLGWRAETTLFGRHDLERGLWRYVKKIGNPVIWRAPDGHLYLWMVNVSLGGWAGSAVSWSRSTDEGATWTAPRRLVTSPFLNISTLVKGAPFAYANGQIGLPVYHEFIAKLGETVRLDPQGHVLDKVRIPASHTSLQPVALMLGASDAQVYMRSGNATALMLSETQDAGKTWSPTRRTELHNPDSALAGLVDDKGRRWLALNPHPSNRETLSLAVLAPGAALSEKSLRAVEASPSPAARLALEPYLVLLKNELLATGTAASDVDAYLASAKRQLCSNTACAQEFSYPYLLQSSDGFVHLVYTWHRTRIKHIRLDPAQPGLASDVSAAN